MGWWWLVVAASLVLLVVLAAVVQTWLQEKAKQRSLPSPPGQLTGVWLDNGHARADGVVYADVDLNAMFWVFDPRNGKRVPVAVISTTTDQAGRTEWHAEELVYRRERKFTGSKPGRRQRGQRS